MCGIPDGTGRGKRLHNEVSVVRTESSQPQKGAPCMGKTAVRTADNSTNQKCKACLNIKHTCPLPKRAKEAPTAGLHDTKHVARQWHTSAKHIHDCTILPIQQIT